MPRNLPKPTGRGPRGVNQPRVVPQGLGESWAAQRNRDLGPSRAMYDRRIDAERRAVLEQIAMASRQGGGDLVQQVLSAFPGQQPGVAPRVPTQPVAGNPFAGTATAARRFQRQSAARMRKEGVPAAYIAENAALATGLQNKLRASYAEAALERQGALAKARYEQTIGQIKADQQAAQAQSLNFSTVQALAAEGVDPTPFLNNPLAAAVLLGRMRYARRSETGLTGPQLAAFAEAGIDPSSYPSMQDAWRALGEQRRQRAYGDFGSTEAFLEFYQRVVGGGS